jgi:hypothetical protein
MVAGKMYRRPDNEGALPQQYVSAPLQYIE